MSSDDFPWEPDDFAPWLDEIPSPELEEERDDFDPRYDDVGWDDPIERSHKAWFDEQKSFEIIDDEEPTSETDGSQSPEEADRCFDDQPCSEQVREFLEAIRSVPACGQSRRTAPEGGAGRRAVRKVVSRHSWVWRVAEDHLANLASTPRPLGDVSALRVADAAVRLLLAGPADLPALETEAMSFESGNRAVVHVYIESELKKRSR